MRVVARRAGCVLGGGEHRLIAVAARACLHLGLAETMRLVTAGAARVSGGQRAIVDVELARPRRVAAHATLIRGVVGLVHAMAIEATVQAGVHGLLGSVTARARPGIERWRLMRVMAIAAGLIGVRTDRVLAILGPVVAAHARRFRTRAKAVAVLARGRVGAGMQRRRLAGMAALADVGRRWRESRVAVAVRARNLADVSGVASARRDVVIRRRYLLRYRIFDGMAAPDHERDERDHAHHGRDPIA